MSSVCFDTNCCQIWAHLSSIEILIKTKNILRIVLWYFISTFFSTSVFLIWQHQNEGIPFWVAQMSLILLQEESEDKGQQSLLGQELRWLLVRQHFQPRKSKQFSNELKLFYICRCQRVCGFLVVFFLCVCVLCSFIFQTECVLLHSV